MRSKRNNIILLGTLLTVFGFLSLPLLSYAVDTAQSLQDQINTKNNDIANLQKEIDAYQRQIDDIGQQANTLSGSIKQLDITEKKLLADIKVTETKISSANLTINKLSLQIGQKSTDIVQNKDAVADIIKSVEQSDSVSLMESLLGSKDIAASWKEVDHFLQIQEKITGHVATLKDDKKNLEDQKIQIEKAKADLSALRSKLTDQQKIVASNKKEKNKLLAETKNQESNYKKLLADRLKKKQAVEAELQQYESKLKFILDPKTLPKGGVLDWPLDYVLITQKFGKTTSSGRLYASGTHSGVDFRAAVGTPVKALGDGVVLGYGNTDLTCPGASFGNWILIDYGNGLASAFGHLSLIKVSQGQHVSRGDVVGYSGNTGYSIAPHLHVTIYAASAVKVENRPSAACGGKVYTMPIAPTNAYLDPLVYLPGTTASMYKNGAGDD